MSDLDRIEVSINEAKEAISFHECLKRLEANPDFKQLITEGYFRDEASRLVLLKADPSMEAPEQQKALDNAIIAVGGLRQYFSQVYQMGMIASRSLAQDEVTQAELMAEE